MAHKRVNYPSAKLKGIYPESTAGVGDGRSNPQSYKELGMNTSDNYNFSLGNWTERSADNRTFIANINLGDENEIFSAGSVDEDPRGRPIRIRHNLLDTAQGYGSAPFDYALCSMFVEINSDGVVTKVLKAPEPNSEEDQSFCRSWMLPHLNMDLTNANLTGYYNIAVPNNIYTISPKYYYDPVPLVFRDDASVSTYIQELHRTGGSQYSGAMQKRREDILEFMFYNIGEMEEDENGYRTYTINPDSVLYNPNYSPGPQPAGLYSSVIEFSEGEPNAFIKPFRDDYGTEEGEANLADQDSLVIEFSETLSQKVANNILVRPCWEEFPNDANDAMESIISFIKTNPSVNGFESRFEQAMLEFNEEQTYEILFPRTWFIKNPADQLFTKETFAEFWGDEWDRDLNYTGDSGGDGYPDLPDDPPPNMMARPVLNYYGGFFDTGIQLGVPFSYTSPNAPLGGLKLPLANGFRRPIRFAYNPDSYGFDYQVGITDEGDLTPAESSGGGPVIELPHFSRIAHLANLSGGDELPAGSEPITTFSPEHGINVPIYWRYLGYPKFNFSLSIEEETLIEPNPLKPMDFIVDVKSDLTSKELLYYDMNSEDYDDTSYPLKVNLNVDIFVSSSVDSNNGVIKGSGLMSQGFTNSSQNTIVQLYNYSGDLSPTEGQDGTTTLFEIGQIDDPELYTDNAYAFLSPYYYHSSFQELLGVAAEQVSSFDETNFHYRYEVVQWGDELLQASTDSILNSFYFKSYDDLEFPQANDYSFKKLSSSQIKNAIPLQYTSTHTYNTPGVKNIKIIVYKYSKDGVYVYQTSLVTKNIAINSRDYKSQDFEVFGGTDFKFLPIFNNQVVIGGFEFDSSYHSSVQKITKDDNFLSSEYLERISSRDYVNKFADDTLGKSPGNIDLGQTRVFSEPKSIYDFIGGSMIGNNTEGYTDLPLNSSVTDIFIDDKRCLMELNPQDIDERIILNKVGGVEKGILIGDYEVQQPPGGRVSKVGVMEIPKLDTKNDKQAF